jgi:hypothetical protein
VTGSDMHTQDPSLPSPFKLAKNTGTVNYRYHLCVNHLDKWVSECDQKNIRITAKSALPFVNKY